MLALLAPPVEKGKVPTTRLYVRTVPSGAQVLLGGQPLGKSNGLFEVPPGRHKITVHLKGYQDEAHELEVVGQQITRLVLKLKPAVEPAAPLPRESATVSPAGAASKLRYGFKPPQKYVYEVKIVAQISDVTETREGLSIYTAKSATDQQITLQHTGSLSTRRAKQDGQPVYTLPSVHNPLMWTDNLKAKTADLTIGRRGDVVEGGTETALPYILGPFAVLVLDEFPSEPKSSWEKKLDLVVSQVSRSHLPPFAHGPFGPKEPPAANRSAHEVITFKVVETGPQVVRIEKTYRLWTDDKADDKPRRELVGDGETSFDPVLGVPKSQLMKYELRLNEENLSMKVPLKVSFRLLDTEEAQQRLTAIEEAKAAAEAAAAKAREVKSLEPGEREQLLKQLKEKDEFRVRAAADRLARAPADEQPAEVTKALAALLSDRSHWVRTAAANALVNWATSDAAAALIAAAEDKDIFVRAPAMLALARVKTPEAAQAVAKQLPMHQGRAEAAKALKMMGPVAEPAVLPLLKDRDGFVQKEACEILQEIGTGKSISALEEYANSGSPFAKGAGQKALEAIRARR